MFSPPQETNLVKTISNLPETFSAPYHVVLLSIIQTGFWNYNQQPPANVFVFNKHTSSNQGTGHRLEILK